MKVTHFIASIDKTGGGTTAYMKLIAEELGQFEIDQIIVAGNTENPVEIDCAKVVLLDSIALTPFHRKRVKLLFNHYTSFLKEEAPDLVHINGLWNYENSLFQKAAQKLKIKVIVSPHGMLEPYILKRNFLKKKVALFMYQDKALKNATAIHATASSELEQIKKLGYHNNSTIIPNGIETSLIPQKKWELSESGTRNLLFLSRIHPKKGIDMLIKAMSKLNSDKLKITIAGNGEDKYINDLIQLSKDCNVDKQFDFIGPIYGDEKWDLYCKSDVFVLPTHSENFGIVVAEALYIGLPVLTTTGTPWEELETHKCGWWINLSEDNLVRCLHEIIDLDNESLKEMGEQGVELIKNKYTIQSVTKAMYQFYQECVLI